MKNMEAANELPAMVNLTCPCGVSVRPTTLYRVSTDAIDRECAGCRSLWRVIIRPIKTGNGIAVHRVEWTCMRGGR